MGVTSLPNVVRDLLSYGMPPSTPAAMIERGTTSRQRVVRSSVSGLPAAVSDAALEPPALFVIGPAVKYAEKLEWFDKSPLFGERIVLAQPAGEMSEVLELNGADVVEVPLPVTPAARVVMGALPLTGVVFRTVDDVDALDEDSKRFYLKWNMLFPNFNWIKKMRLLSYF